MSVTVLLVALLVPAAIAAWFSAPAVAFVVLGVVVVLMVQPLHRRIADLERDVKRLSTSGTRPADGTVGPPSASEDAPDTVPLPEPPGEPQSVGQAVVARAAIDVDERSTRVTSS